MTNAQMTKLNEPFPDSEIKFYAAALTADKKQGKVAAYADTRAYMDHLDRVLGPENWATEYIIHDQANKAVECRLSINTENGWVTKANIGYPNEAKDAANADKEPLKAAYSDALKRAAVEWGVGRFLYSLKLKHDWLEVDDRGRFKTPPHILRDGEKPARQAAQQNRPSQPQRKDFWTLLCDMGYDRDQVSAASQRFYNGREPADLSAIERKELIVRLEAQKKEQSVA